MNQCVPLPRQRDGRRWRRVAAPIASPHLRLRERLPPPLPPHAPAFRLPVQGQPPSDVTTTVTPTTPPLLPTGVGYALFFPMDATARATAEAQVAAAMAKRAAATVQTAMAALAAAYVGQRAHGSHWLWTAHPPEQGHGRPPLRMPGRGCKCHPLQIRGWHRPLPHHCCLRSARLPGQNHGVPSTPAGAELPSALLPASRPAHPEAMASSVPAPLPPRPTSPAREDVAARVPAGGLLPSIPLVAVSSSVRQAPPLLLPPHADSTYGQQPPPRGACLCIGKPTS